MNFTDLGATGIIGLIIAIFVIIGFIKGLINIVFGLIALSGAAFATWFIYGYAQEIFFTGIYTQSVIALVFGVVVFIIIRRLLKFIINPFNSSKAGSKFGFGLPAAVLSFCATLFTIWIALIGVRYAGAIAELRNTLNYIIGEAPKNRDVIVTSTIAKIDGTTLGNWHISTDPYNSKAKQTLSKILFLYHDQKIRDKMLEKPALNSILNNHDFLKNAYQEDLVKLIQTGKLSQVYNSDFIHEILLNESLNSELEELEYIELSKLK